MNLKIGDVWTVTVSQEQEWRAALEQGRLPNIRREQEELWISQNGVKSDVLEEPAVPQTPVLMEKKYDLRPLSVQLYRCDEYFKDDRINIKPSVKTYTTGNLTKQLYSCPFCDKTYILRCHVMRHLFGHIGGKPFGLTAKKTQTPSHSDSLLQSDTPNKEAEPPPCSINTKLVSQDSRDPLECDDDSEDDAWSQNCGNLEELHTCPNCDKTYKQKWDLTRHMAIHQRNKTHLKTYRKRTRIQSHSDSLLQSDTPNKEAEPPPCSINTKLVSQDSRDPSECDDDSEDDAWSQKCGAWSQNCGNLEELHTCPNCDKTYKQKWDLTRHMAIHQRNKTHLKTYGKRTQIQSHSDSLLQSAPREEAEPPPCSIKSKEPAVPLTAFPVKNELFEKPLSVLPHQSPVEKAEPPPCRIKKEPDGEAANDSYPAANFHPDARHVMMDFSKPKTGVSRDDRKPLESDNDSEDNVRSQNGGNVKQLHTYPAVPLTAFPVKNELFEKPVSMLPHQSPHKKAETPPCRINTEADGGAASDFDAVDVMMDFSEPENRVSEGDREPSESDDDSEDDVRSQNGGNSYRQLYECPFCDKPYERKRDLTHHMAIHLGEGTRFNACDEAEPPLDRIHMEADEGATSDSHPAAYFHLDEGDVAMDWFEPETVAFEDHKTLESNEDSDDAWSPDESSLSSESDDSRGRLRRRVETHTTEQLYTCAICYTKHKTKSHLKRHMEGHMEGHMEANGPPSFTCSVCGQTFAQQRQLTIHWRNHTGRDPFYACILCGEAFDLKSHLESHMGTHTGPIPYTCSICLETFRDKAALVCHLLMHSNMMRHMGEECYPCLICNKEYCQEGMMKLHMDTHSNDKDLTCRLCGKGFSRYSEVKNHNCYQSLEPQSLLKSEDNGIQKTEVISLTALKCTYCPRVFSKGGRLTEHLSKHIGSKLLNCVICGFSLYSETSSKYSSHTCKRSKLLRYASVKDVVDENNDSQEKISIDDGLRTGHMRDKHLVCSLCKTEHEDRDALMTHMRTHTMHTQYHCPICEKGFAWRRSLKKHIEEGHTTAKHKCQKCQKYFTWRYQLAYHNCIPASSRPHQREREPEHPSVRETDGGAAHLQAGTDSFEFSDKEASDGGRGPKPLTEGPDDKTVETAGAASDDSVDSDFWKENRQRKN